MQTHLHSGQFRSTPTPMVCRFSEFISYERSYVSTRVSPTKHEILCIKSLRLFTGKRDHTWRPKSSLWLNKTNMRSRCRSLTSTESALRTLPPPPTNDYGLSEGLKVPAASPNTTVKCPAKIPSIGNSRMNNLHTRNSTGEIRWNSSLLSNVLEKKACHLGKQDSHFAITWT